MDNCQLIREQMNHHQKLTQRVLEPPGLRPSGWRPAASPVTALSCQSGAQLFTLHFLCWWFYFRCTNPGSHLEVLKNLPIESCHFDGPRAGRSEVGKAAVVSPHDGHFCCRVQPLALSRLQSPEPSVTNFSTKCKSFHSALP